MAEPGTPTTSGDPVLNAELARWAANPQVAPVPNLAGLVAFVCDSVLNFGPLFAVAAAGGPPTDAAAWLDARAAAAPARHAPAAARAVAIAASASRPEAAAEGLARTLASARALGEGYASTALTAPPGWLDAVGGSRLRAALDSAFLSGVALVRVLAGAAGGVAAAAGGAPGPAPPPSPPATVASLDALSHLAFARSRLPAYADLVAALVATAAASPQARPDG